VTDLEQLTSDYRHLREDVGAYRLPRDVVRLEGPGAAEYLQGQLSQDLGALAPGGSVDTLVLAPDGKIDALARVVRLDEEVFHIDTDGGFGPALLARLARFKLRSRFELTLTDWTCVALRGRRADSASLDAPVVASVDWNGWRGFDLLGPADAIVVAPTVPWCSGAAWEAARIESGVPVMGREITDGVIPAEAGVVDRTVSFTKGCFTGQELVARIDSRKAAAPHRLAGLVLDEQVDAEALQGASLAVEDKERPVGRVTSAAWCPGLRALCALGYVHRSVPDPGRVQVVGRNGDPDRVWWASVRPLPLL